jgi:hypothetical protein
MLPWTHSAAFPFARRTSRVQARAEEARERAITNGNTADEALCSSCNTGRRGQIESRIVTGVSWWVSGFAFLGEEPSR